MRNWKFNPSGVQQSGHSARFFIIGASMADTVGVIVDADHDQEMPAEVIGKDTMDDEIPCGMPSDPYLVTSKVVFSHNYNPDYGDDNMCKCGHRYYRHFDSYDDMENVGCKYCDCFEFMEENKDERV